MSYRPLLLYRNVNARIRYYKIEAFKTLFGDYVLVKSFGAVRNKKPTGVRQEYFETFAELEKAIDLTLTRKFKKGYTQC